MDAIGGATTGGGRNRRWTWNRHVEDGFGGGAIAPGRLVASEVMFEMARDSKPSISKAFNAMRQLRSVVDVIQRLSSVCLN